MPGSFMGHRKMKLLMNREPGLKSTPPPHKTPQKRGTEGVQPKSALAHETSKKKRWLRCGPKVHLPPLPPVHRPTQPSALVRWPPGLGTTVHSRDIQPSLYLVAMERAGATPLSFEPPAEGGGRPPRPHGPVAREAAASALRGRAGARDPGRVTRPVASATTHTAAIKTTAR